MHRSMQLFSRMVVDELRTLAQHSSPSEYTLAVLESSVFLLIANVAANAIKLNYSNIHNI